MVSVMDSIASYQQVLRSPDSARIPSWCYRLKAQNFTVEQLMDCNLCCSYMVIFSWSVSMWYAVDVCPKWVLDVDFNCLFMAGSCILGTPCSLDLSIVPIWCEWLGSLVSPPFVKFKSFSSSALYDDEICHALHMKCFSVAYVYFCLYFTSYNVSVLVSW